MAFGPLMVAFDAAVLRPRPWTLAQSEWAAELAPGVPPGPILELASGAGHIGLAAAVRSGRDLVQVDVSEAACGWAEHNAAAAGVADRVDVRCGSFSSAVGPDERFPLVIADPPYVPSGDVGRFPEDPASAIDGGDDGLELVDQCLEVAAAHLAAGGAVVLQVGGPEQAAALGARDGPLTVVAVRSFGVDRALVHLAASAVA